MVSWYTSQILTTHSILTSYLECVLMQDTSKATDIQLGTINESEILILPVCQYLSDKWMFLLSL